MLPEAVNTGAAEGCDLGTRLTGKRARGCQAGQGNGGMNERLSIRRQRVYDLAVDV